MEQFCTMSSLRGKYLKPPLEAAETMGDNSVASDNICHGYIPKGFEGE